jgi:hypothetical protein
MKTNNIFLGIILIIALLFPLYQIHKYGFTAYYNKRLERKQRKYQQIKNFFS